MSYHFSVSCKVCGNLSGNKIHIVREMYLGTREKFDYLECDSCGCLQLLNIPADMSQYYPKDYFTFHQKIEGKLKSFLNCQRDKASLGENTFLGDLLLKIFGTPTYIEKLKTAKVSFSDSILDVGCGKGILLHRMKESGFKNVIGIDPYLDRNIRYKNGLTVLKKTLDEINGSFDFIMFNHSFEHMENPLHILERTNKLLNPERCVLLRIPVSDSYAWKKYGTYWCSIDAPRHFYLHTKKSIAFLAHKSGFEIVKITYDSRSWQFWGSEQYARDISLLDENSYFVNPGKSVFTKKDIEGFEKKTRQLNLTGEGDQAEFYLKKV